MPYSSPVDKWTGSTIRDSPRGSLKKAKWVKACAETETGGSETKLVN